MRVAIGHGLHGAPWADDRPGAHVVRAAKMSVDSGTGPYLPGLDDLRRGSRAAPQPGAVRDLRAATDQPRVRPGAQGAPPPRPESPPGCR